jgi:predicted lipid-binding transport protein (Tim44 family)
MKLLSILFALSMVLSTDTALAAKRLGGGGSLGKQSANVTQRSTEAPASAPAPAVAPAAAPVKSASAPATAGAPVAAPPQRRPWGAMLGGLAAGLGLAWLASSLGFGEGFAHLLLVGLLALLVVGVVGAWMRSRQQRQEGEPSDGLAYQGAGAAMHQARDYSPKNVGNDASARPWERNTTGFQASRFQEAPGSLIGSALPSASSWGIPQGFDVDGFLKASKTNFINLQAAWDRADIPSLRAMMTDEMLDQIKAQLADRERQAPGAVNVTEVVMLDARLLGIEETEVDYMASVEFSGMIREDASAGPNPFREVWNITRPKAGPGGWLVAGVQALQ